tara:strand:+ start:315 stop:584 length:270 start_codon:yes stop_codon:yes gene_type:complete
MITPRDWQRLTDKAPEIAKTRAQLNRDLWNLERKLKNKGYQKSTAKKKFYALMETGLVPYDTAKEATAARRAEVRKNIKKVKLILAKMV